MKLLSMKKQPVCHRLILHIKKYMYYNFLADCYLESCFGEPECFAALRSSNRVGRIMWRINETIKNRCENVVLDYLAVKNCLNLRNWREIVQASISHFLVCVYCDDRSTTTRHVEILEIYHLHPEVPGERKKTNHCCRNMLKHFANRQIVLQSSESIQCILWFEKIIFYLIPVW